MLNRILLLCRPGFEKECSGEIIKLANSLSVPAYIKAEKNTGFVFLISSISEDLRELMTLIQFNQLIFTRQWFATTSSELTLPDNNRLPDILYAVKQLETNVYDLEMDYPDTNEGKALNRFCRQFKPHVKAALNKNHLFSAHAKWRLHLFFHDSQHINIGLSPVENSSPHSMGIIRLKMPSSAPSRSTLKLEEAIHWFLAPVQRKKMFTPGMKIVDLGAAPGGWSWQFVQRGGLVTAVDNGPMQDELMQSGMVEHLKVDAFTYTPSSKVDWLVCDMAERPLHVSRLISRWFTQNLCQHALFNLKLPMKKRLASVEDCLHLLDGNLSSLNIAYTIRARQLYHDREEITVCITTDNYRCC